MTIQTVPTGAARPTLQDVLDRLAANPALSQTRLRDLRSAVTCYAALIDSTPAFVPLDLPAIRAVLDLMVPIQAKVSRKRWANLRSDLTAAIAASGLLPMLKTAPAELSESWSSLFERAGSPYLRHGLSRFARWASERQIAPSAVTKVVVDQFIEELLAGSLARKILDLRQNIVRSWNALILCLPNEGLQPIAVTKRQHGPPRFPWHELPASFRDDVEGYLAWAAVPDPLDENARASELAPRTRNLRKDHIHSAVTAAIACGVNSAELVTLGALATAETFKTILRHRWESEGRKVTAYTRGIAGSLIAIAKEWVKVPDEQLAALKAIRRKLGAMPSGLTKKNKETLRQFNDPQLLARLVKLPDRLWRQAASRLKTSRRDFIELQSAVAIDILLVAPLRMQNLAALKFDEHIQWPHGRDKPAVILCSAEETKNKNPLEFDLPSELSTRLLRYRNQIAPAVTGKRPDALFVTWQGKPRSQAAIALAIVKTVLKHVGIRMTPHQFRHLAAKIILDRDPGAYPLVQQLMGHRNMQTTQNFYGGIETRRAGRAHSELIAMIRKQGAD
jgi:integrase